MTHHPLTRAEAVEAEEKAIETTRFYARLGIERERRKWAGISALLAKEIDSMPADHP